MMKSEYNIQHEENNLSVCLIVFIVFLNFDLKIAIVLFSKLNLVIVVLYVIYKSMFYLARLY